MLKYLFNSNIVFCSDKTNKSPRSYESLSCFAC